MAAVPALAGGTPPPAPVADATRDSPTWTDSDLVGLPGVSPRRLAAVVLPVRGEAFGSWVERFAADQQIPAGQAALALGLPMRDQRGDVRPLFYGIALTPAAQARLTAATGLPPGRLAGMQLARFSTPATTHESGLFLEGRARGRATQTAGRNALHRIGPFKATTADEGREWASVIKAMEDALVLYQHTPGSLALHHWQYIHDRTGGSIASLAELIRESAIHASDTGVEAITPKLMDEIVINEDATERYQTIIKRKAPGHQSRHQGHEWQGGGAGGRVTNAGTRAAMTATRGPLASPRP